ncbi:UDP-glucose 4-epimerase GalE [Pseudomonas sp. ANT_J12]|uniref:UDP-glucose 4-epimerase GalE n=1 Tax=Pseudomonas sp. ANT_J12 TaxID=2597351 RepID=UPI0011F32E7D|nr:UDP-glucose 4-epimerase GalE [Pseudomonas sp. ANT_J12]KAA0995007.1 UDP-glucose 4-epimerase GalE [Pseudomonas sp. ANT_J12]
MKILVTGGTGYIGSHTTLALLEAGFEVVVLDNLSNSSDAALHAVEAICGKRALMIHGDVCDRPLLDRIFQQHAIDAVLHFAGLKAVGESVRKPLEYYEANVGGSITLCQAMAAAGVFRLVFSSSATVYGAPEQMPISEEVPTGSPTNPYGQSKLIVENVLRDLCSAEPRWSVALLRYFNPIGAHASGHLGEDPNGIPNNLVPYISQVAVGSLKELSIFGDDYPTSDGTGVRDYIHVVDLADGHIKALQSISQTTGIHIWNLGTGDGYSVMQVLHAFEQASGRPVPYRILPRRSGDVAESLADPSKAERELGWKATRSLQQMMTDTWRWQSNHPKGYLE